MEDGLLSAVKEASGCPQSLFAGRSWTVALIEDLRGRSLSVARVRSVLSTALPLRSDFVAYLNGIKVAGRKDEYKPIIEFDMPSLLNSRKTDLDRATTASWRRLEPQAQEPEGEGDESSRIGIDVLRSGVSGTVKVFERTLLGKSDDLMRRHGFFVYVRGRVVNPDDPLFGMTAKQHQTFNRFRCDIEAADLDRQVLSFREEVAESEERRHVRLLLNACFQEARGQH